MKIKKIELINIGLYKKQSIDLYSQNKSLTIFWGNNGAGKTTLLNSIKVCLLGQKLYGSNYEQYNTFIKDKLISSRIQDCNEQASIKICLEMKEQNKLIDYIVERTFAVSNDVLEENLNIYKETEKLDFIQKESFLNKIEMHLPPTLLDVIIFDGENAITILDKNEMHKLVKNIVFAVFGMDVYSNLVKDLNNTLKNLNISGNENSSKELELINSETRYKECLLEVNSLSSSIAAYNKQKNTLLSSLSNMLKKISNKTGVEFNEIVTIKNDLTELKHTKKALDEEIRYINEEILPLKILHKKIKTSLIQIKAERPYMILNNIESLKGFFSNDPTSLNKLIELENKIKVNGEIQLKFNLNENDFKLISDVDSLLDTFTVEKLKDYYSNQSDAFAVLKNKLDSLDKLGDEQSKEILTDIEKLCDELSEIQGDIDSLTTNLDLKNKELTFNKTEYEKIKKYILSLKKESNSYINIQLYKDALEDFIELNITNVCEKLSESVFAELKRINFRNGSIKKVYVSPKSYDVHLYEPNGKLIPSKLFSAGEKQILLGLVLKEAINLSKIDTFFLFDTPVGRLDMKNRKVFTEEVIFKVSEQSVIFATDSDYTAQDYSLIKKKITNEFKLTRNKRDQIVVVKGSIY